jgi:hypothetical protein
MTYRELTIKVEDINDTLVKYLGTIKNPNRLTKEEANTLTKLLFRLKKAVIAKENYIKSQTLIKANFLNPLVLENGLSILDYESHTMYFASLEREDISAYLSFKHPQHSGLKLTEIEPAKI